MPRSLSDVLADSANVPVESGAATVAKAPLQKQQIVAQRSRARRLALQALYQWQIADHELAELLNQFARDPAMRKADGEYFREIIQRVLGNFEAYKGHISPLLDRQWENLDVIERSVLLIGIHELSFRPDVPFKVVINEGVKMAVDFGGTDSHNYINGVLDKLARKLRPEEVK